MYSPNGDQFPCTGSTHARALASALEYPFVRDNRQNVRGTCEMYSAHTCGREVYVKGLTGADVPPSSQGGTVRAILPSLSGAGGGRGVSTVSAVHGSDSRGFTGRAQLPASQDQIDEFKLISHLQLRNSTVKD